jgi:hypothetical protein
MFISFINSCCAHMHLCNIYFKEYMILSYSTYHPSSYCLLHLSDTVGQTIWSLYESHYCIKFSLHSTEYTITLSKFWFDHSFISSIAIFYYRQLPSGGIQNNYTSTDHKCFTASAITVLSNLVNLMKIEKNTMKTGTDIRLKYFPQVTKFYI